MSNWMLFLSLAAGAALAAVDVGVYSDQLALLQTGDPVHCGGHCPGALLPVQHDRLYGSLPDPAGY